MVFGPVSCSWQQAGGRYRDVSLICRDPQRYYGVLDVALAKRDIPCFVSQPIRMEAQPVARLALGAFRAAASGCATEDLLLLLKTGLLGFTAQEVSALENYAYLWKITGAGWRQEFVRHPRGFGEEFTQEDREELSRLNELRRRLVEPLLAFSAGAMFCVVLEELIPAAMRNKRRHGGTCGFCLGFLLMMILDVALG